MNHRLLYIIVLITGLASCKTSTPVYESFNGFIQGTTYSMIYQKTGNLEPLTMRQNVEKILYDFDMSLSLYVDSSILAKVNRNEETTLDTYFIEAFNKSKVISAMTNGAFDITVGPLVKAWGFGPDAHKNFSESKRDSLLKLVGMEKVSIVNGRLIKYNPDINLDFNAIAQGYSVDVICAYFDRLKIKTYLIEIGGEVRVKGDKGGNPWRIGIDKPEDNNMSPGDKLQAIIRIKNRALTTSGNYRKFYIENGIKYSHTIDPKTGYPAKNKLLSATILADECATADGIATACMVMGKEKTIDFISKHPEFQAFLIYSDESGSFQTWMSESLKKSISETE